MFTCVEERAQLKHNAWMLKLRKRGVTSRVSYWGEELMVPWAQLSPEGQEYNIDDIRDGDALVELMNAHKPEEKSGP